MKAKKLFIKKVGSKVAKQFGSSGDTFVVGLNYFGGLLSFAIKDVGFFFSFVKDDGIRKIIKLSGLNEEDTLIKEFRDKEEAIKFLIEALDKNENLGQFYNFVLNEEENKEVLLEKINELDLCQVRDTELKDYQTKNWKIDTKKYGIVQINDIVSLMLTKEKITSTEQIIENAVDSFKKNFELRKYLTSFGININKIRQEIQLLEKEDKKNELNEISKMREKIPAGVFEVLLDTCKIIF